MNNQAEIEKCNIQVIDYYLLLGHLLLLLLLLLSFFRDLLLLLLLLLVLLQRNCPVTYYYYYYLILLPHPWSGGQCHLIHLTILNRLSWPNLLQTQTRLFVFYILILLLKHIFLKTKVEHGKLNFI